jgi:hypothetical protein
MLELSLKSRFWGGTLFLAVPKAVTSGSKSRFGMFSCLCPYQIQGVGHGQSVPSFPTTRIHPH